MRCNRGTMSAFSSITMNTLLGSLLYLLYYISCAQQPTPPSLSPIPALQRGYANIRNNQQLHPTSSFVNTYHPEGSASPTSALPRRRSGRWTTHYRRRMAPSTRLFARRPPRPLTAATSSSSSIDSSSLRFDTASTVNNDTFSQPPLQFNNNPSSQFVSVLQAQQEPRRQFVINRGQQLALNRYRQQQAWNQRHNSHTTPIDSSQQPSSVQMIAPSPKRPLTGRTPVASSSPFAALHYIMPDGTLHGSICNTPKGLLGLRRDLCRRYFDLMISVIRGYFMGLRECALQFSGHRWNCQGFNMTIPSTSLIPANRRRRRLIGRHVDNRKLRTYLDMLLSKGTREAAYVMAVTSAGVSHSVTRACSSGLHDSCGCDRTIYNHPREPNFEWSGCSDNIYFGAAFARNFLDAREDKRLGRNRKLGLTNLHNNHVGRQSVINKMQVRCKCHGVSGSCEMRTCWRSLPNFSELADHLQNRFENAIKVDYINKRLITVDDLIKLRQSIHAAAASSSSSTTNDNDLTSSLATQLRSLRGPSEDELIFTNDSPDFCGHNPHFGSLGTRGRQCDIEGDGPNSCNHLCCDRGYEQEEAVIDEVCQCKFEWCCKVRCKTCRKNVVIYTCK